MLISGIAGADGTFTYQVGLPGSAATTVFPVQSGDFNGDGKTDLVVSVIPPEVPGTQPSPSATSYGVALSNGDGTFQTPVAIPLPNPLVFFVDEHSFAVGDVNGDGKLDVVFVYIGDTQGIARPPLTPAGYFVALGKGDGTFHQATFTPFGDSPRSLLLGHFHGTAAPMDLVIGDESFVAHQPAATMLQGAGDGTFGSPVVLNSGLIPYSLLSADLNKDGIPDIVLSAPVDIFGEGSKGGLFEYLGHGDGTFSPAALIDPASDPGYAVAADVNGDGNLDIVFDTAFHYSVDTDSPGLSVLLGHGDGTFGPSTNYPSTYGGVPFAGSFLGVSAPSILIQSAAGTAFYRNQSVPAAPDFTLAASTTALTVTRGQSVTTQLTIAANSGLSGALSFACSGLPSEATCSFSPASVTATPGQSAMTTLNISTRAPTVAALDVPAVTNLGRAMGAIALFMLMPGWGSTRRRWAQCGLLLCAIMLAAAGLAGCGTASRAVNNPSDPGSPIGSSVVTVTVTAEQAGTPVSHTLMLNLTVQ